MRITTRRRCKYCQAGACKIVLPNGKPGMAKCANCNGYGQMQKVIVNLALPSPSMPSPRLPKLPTLPAPREMFNRFCEAVFNTLFCEVSYATA